MQKPAFTVGLFRPTEKSQYEQMITRTSRTIGNLADGQFHFLKSTDAAIDADDKMHGEDEESGEKRHKSLLFNETNKQKDFSNQHKLQSLYHSTNTSMKSQSDGIFAKQCFEGTIPYRATDALSIENANFKRLKT